MSNILQNASDTPPFTARPRDPKQQSLDLAEIARFGVISDDLSFELDRDPTYSDAYGDLSAQLWAEFVSKAQSLKDARYTRLATLGSIALGFNVLGKILSFAPAAYVIYCEQTEAKIDLEQLGAILHDSKGILKLFAKRDNSSNVTLENAFGLRGYQPFYDKIPFVIGLNSEGQICLLPAQNTLDGATLDIYRLDRITDENAQCPAYGLVLNNIWDAAVDHCVTEPQLFAASLGSSQ